MGFIDSSRPNMTDEQIWQQIVVNCLNSSQKTINCGSALRRRAILEMNKRVVNYSAMYEALKRLTRETRPYAYKGGVRWRRLLVNFQNG